MSEQVYDVIVVGAGVTGLAAAREASLSGLAVAVVEPEIFGGLVININELDGNILGSGADLASQMMIEATEGGAVMLSESVRTLGREGSTLTVETDSGAHRARSVILASGARLKHLGIPGEAEFEHRGVACCADCDGPMYQGSDVVVVGGGDSALQEALVLARFCRRVHVVHRGGQFRAKPHLQEALAACDNVTVHFRTEVLELLGGTGVEQARIRNLDDHGGGAIACSGVFPFIGLAPSAEYVPPAVARDRNGFLLTDSELKTAVAGVFAAGAVRSGYGGMLEHAMSEGVAAAQAAARELGVRVPAASLEGL